ncbi:mucin-5AC isoform X2 [Oreochromis niloticus]|uniref:mucin-5AC isoform X2 n=1 Tax=Oreochromis niloticus TaxID=8128 RepID=UPI000904A22E|nr:mucin-5AC isoform X2 [Oreochromis niloticus]
MKHTLVCFIFLTALQDGNTGLVKAQTLTHRAEEGGNITVKCSFYFSGSRKLFCKEKCENGNILVETSDDAAQNGRYSIKYEIKGFFSYTLYVSITQLKQSDSGRYRCSLDRIFDTGKDEFELIVTAASTTSTPNGTLRPFSASVFLSSASTPPTTQSLSSTSGSSTPSSASAPPKMETTQSLSSTSGSSTPSSASTETKDARSDVLIYVGLILVVMIVVLSAALLIFCMRRKTTKPRGPPVETEYADTQADRLYEEIRECDIPSRSPPVEVSSVYATANDPRSDGVENIDLYSLATSPHNNADNLCYAEVEFSHIPATSSAPCGEATDVVYSVPQVDLSTASHTKDASPPVYSTVSSL